MNGGIWTIKLMPEDPVDLIWERLAFALLGEQFADLRVIGITLSIRNRPVNVQVWLKEGEDEALQLKVSNKLRQILKLNPDKDILYYKQIKHSLQVSSLLLLLSDS